MSSNNTGGSEYTALRDKLITALNTSSDLNISTSVDFTTRTSAHFENGTSAELKKYLRSYIFDVEKLAGLKRVLVVEEDPKICQVLKILIQDENPGATCAFTTSVEEALQNLRLQKFDLIIVNYYQADDEVDYEFWDEVREQYPQLEVAVLSHVNDREYYEMLERLQQLESLQNFSPMTAKVKHFFATIFGGQHGKL